MRHGRKSYFQENGDYWMTEHQVFDRGKEQNKLKLNDGRRMRHWYSIKTQGVFLKRE